MIAMVAGLYLQSTMTQKADAIADAGTSSGAACNGACIGVFDDCWQTLSGDPYYFPNSCWTAKDACYDHCDVFGSPFTLWRIF
jgi:putative lipase involved disintegration of autophagic bodies